MKYGITGATGGLGNHVLRHLISMGTEPSSIIALARSKEKAESLESMGVTVRIGNYEDLSSLEKAFKGVGRLLLISGSEIGKRILQHQNVIKAAIAADVSQIIYTSITSADTSVNPLASEHKATEKALKTSGLDFVILRNNWYLENYIGDLGYAKQSGVIAAAAGQGKAASALKTEYAEAAAKVILGQGHSKKIYELAGEPWNYEDLAKAASKVFGKEIVYKNVSAEERKAGLAAAGLPEEMAGFFTLVDESIAAGSLDISSDNLQTILDRKPLPLKEAIAQIA